LIAALLILTIPLQAIHDVSSVSEIKTQRESFVQEVKFGIRYLVNHKMMFHLVLMTTSIGFWFNFGSATMILFMLKTLHLNPAYFGLAMSIQGLGSIFASLTASRMSMRFGRGRLMGMAMSIQCALWLVMACMTNIVPFIALGVVNGCLGTWWNILIMATYQELIPNHLYGRIHGTRRTLVWGMMPFGSLLGGYASSLLGLRAPIVIGGIFGLLISLFNVRFLVRLTDFAAKVEHEKVEG